MGLSASQARLLSITARLTDNEVHSQLITQAKIRLASESASASNEYIDSLSQTKMQMATYDSNGTATYSDLTANYLSTYQPLKNQYSITNASGQNLETSSDIANYESTDSLYNFLDNYGLIANSDDLDTYNKALKNYNDVLLPEYEAQLVIYNQEYEVYKTDKAEYDAEWKAYDEKLAAYNKELQKPDVYSAFVNVVGTSSAPKSCYANAFGGSMGCYEHVLAHLLDFDNDSSTYGKTYDTSVSGLQSTTNWSLISGSAINSDGKSPAFVDVSKEICSADTVNTHYCDGDDDFNTDGKQNLIKQRLDAGGSFDLTSLSDQLILLRSDYIYDSA